MLSEPSASSSPTYCGSGERESGCLGEGTFVDDDGLDEEGLGVLTTITGDTLGRLVARSTVKCRGAKGDTSFG